MKGPGTVIFTKKSSLCTYAKVTMTVKVGIEEVSVDQTELKLKPGETYQLNAVWKPQNASETKLKWQSADPDVAAVSSDGKVTAARPGVTEIWAAPEGDTAVSFKGKAGTCKIIVEE